MLTSPAILAALYFGAALLLSCAYYLVWWVNPDAFIVHQEMNLRPLALWRRANAQPRSHVGKNAATGTTSLEQVNDKYSKLAAEEFQLEDELSKLKPELDIAEQEVRRLGHLHNEASAKNVKDILEQERRDTQNRRDAALAEFTKRVQRNPNELEDAKRVVDNAFKSIAAEQGLSTDAMISQAANTGHLAQLNEAIRLRDDLLSRWVETDRKLLDTRSNIRKLIESWEKERLARLSYFDFLYFSMGVATTNTFGDLVPNDRVVRFLIVVQLVLSLVLIGLFVNAIA